MEWMMLAALVLVVLPVAFIIALGRAHSDLRSLRTRVERLEDEARSRAPTTPLPEPRSRPWEPIAAAPEPPPSPAPTPANEIELPQRPSASSVPAAPVGPPAPPHPTIGLEQLIGGVWLQNVGSVLLLIGVFLMILWSYGTHRVGPGVLVLSGVGLGLALMWRGDVITRNVPPFGHALIGVGLGIIYLTLYLGHVRLGVLSAWVAFAALLVVSFGSVLTGLRYRMVLIAALGVVGAYMPFLMAAWLPLRGLWTSPAGLLAYLAVVNAFVIVMAVRAGWSGLDVMALVLGTLAWIWSFHSPGWGWGIQIGLCALFTMFGLAPLPRLAGVAGRVRPVDMLAITLAPVCLVAASWPFLAYSSRVRVAMLLMVLAIAQLAAALWIDSRRPERDLWRPLTATAVLFLAAALERALGTERTPLAWCLYGLFLLALGLTPRGGGWLRLWGSLILAVAVFWHLGTATDTWSTSMLPVFYSGGLDGLTIVIAALAGGVLLGRKRHELSSEERWTPEVWTAVGHLVLAFWIGQEGSHVATALVEGALTPKVAGLSAAGRGEELRVALSAAAWMAQAMLIALSAPRQQGAFLRWCAAVVGAFAFLNVTGLHMSRHASAGTLLPVVNVSALLELVTIGLAVVASIRQAERRDPTSGSTRWMPEIWAAGASVVLLMWWSREATLAAQLLIPQGGPDDARRGQQVRTAAAAITSGAWLVEATMLLIAGWVRRSPFLRWSGLVLFGVTALKFVFVDLQTVEVFWRFATAIAMGAAMLAISYFYRRRSRRGGVEDPGTA